MLAFLDSLKLDDDEEDSRIKNYALTAILAMFAAVVGNYFKVFGSFINFQGAFIKTSIYYVLPSVFYLHTTKHQM